ncbi:MAG: Gfo/Idh/MocA family protein [Candidatus Helarchaeota archaeon]
MSQNSVNLGLIGIGQIGIVHILSAEKLSNTNFLAAYHPDKNKIEQFTSQYNIEKGYYDLDAFLNDSEIDAIDICTPTFTHFEFIKKGLTSGKKILVEKPITRTLDEFDKMTKLIKNIEKDLMIAQYCRFIPEYQLARKVVLNGDIGVPLSIRAHRRVSAPTYKNWFFNEEKSGGIILDLMIHDIDAVIWILDDQIDTIYANANNFNLKSFNTPDVASVLIKFKKGTLANINGAWILPQKFYTQNPIDTILEIFGDNGIIEINDRTNSFMKVFTTDNGLKLVGTDPFKIYRSEISHFSNCVLNNKPFNIDFNTVRLSLKACLSAIDSYKTGKPVKF